MWNSTQFGFAWNDDWDRWLWRFDHAPGWSNLHSWESTRHDEICFAYGRLPAPSGSFNPDRREYVDATPGEAVAVHPPRVEAAPASIALGAGIRSTRENQYELPRSELGRMLSNLSDFGINGRIVPAFKDGLPQGFKLFSIRPGSIYTKLGIRDGDVIKRINGAELNSPERVLELYFKLKEASRIDLDLERNGGPVRQTYQVL